LSKIFLRILICIIETFVFSSITMHAILKPTIAPAFDAASLRSLARSHVGGVYRNRNYSVVRKALGNDPEKLPQGDDPQIPFPDFPPVKDPEEVNNPSTRPNINPPEPDAAPLPNVPNHPHPRKEVCRWRQYALGRRKTCVGLVVPFVVFRPIPDAMLL
jgi:hypothetical protein